MKIPAEVTEKMGEGYSVGVVASEVVKKESFKASTEDLNLSDLFFLNKGLHYKFEDEYLCIKGYPQIHIRHTVHYDYVVAKFENPIPLPSPNYGSNPHNIYAISGLGRNTVGSTSTVIDNVDLLRKNLNPTQQQELDEEIALAQKSGWIHFSQIKDASGFLDGYKIDRTHYDKEKPAFAFESWQDGAGSNRSSANYKIGTGTYIGEDDDTDNFTSRFNGSFKDGGDIALWFWYPLELTFYLLPLEDWAVQEIDFGELEPSSTGEATVTVYRDPGRNAVVVGHDDDYDDDASDTDINSADDFDDDSELTAKLVFSINGRTIGSKNVTLLRGQEEEVPFSFPTPTTGTLVMSAEINPEPREFEESTYENNILSVTAVIGTDLDLPYWAVSRDIVFTLPASTVRLSKPSNASWLGSASGTLNVYNNSTDLYRKFKADGIAGDTVSMGVSGSNGYISKKARIEATLRRPDFGDDPMNRIYANNEEDPLLRVGQINTDGPAEQDWRYWCRHSKDSATSSHYVYGTASGDLSDVDFSTDHYASVYNGIETKDFPEQREFESPQAKTAAGRKFRFDLTWEGTHYPLAGERNYKEAEPSKVIRWMAHLGLDNIPQWEYKVAARYQRTFIGQSSGYIAWEIGESQEKFYESDRKAASDRKTGKGNYDNAVFATDKLLQKHDWPIKSGYYFNPGGTYKCTVYTEQYKDTPQETEEHAELVEKIKEAFCYDNGLYYINTNYQEGRKLGDITYKTDRGILTTEGTEYDLETEELYSAIELDKAEAIDGLIKEVLEGYKESGTEEHYEDARIYREQTDKKLFLVKETTVIEFTLAIPEGKNVYTHVNMKNGEYAININIMDIEFDIKDYLELESGKAYHQSSVMKIPKFTLDRLIITVSGSMYDDRS